MPAWAEYLDGGKNGAEVVPLRGKGFNAVRYGILSRHTVLPHEDSAEYDSLLGVFIEEHKPSGATEEYLVVSSIKWFTKQIVFVMLVPGT